MGKTFSVDASYGSITFTGLERKYITGSQITGELKLNILKTLPKACLNIAFQGLERTMIKRSMTVVQNGKIVQINNQTTGKHEKFSVVLPLIAEPTEIQIGEHSYPFSFTVPQSLVSSFEQRYTNQKDVCSAGVRYKVRAVLESEDKDVALYKSQVMEIVRLRSPDELKAFRNPQKHIQKEGFTFIVRINNSFVTHKDVINAKVRLDNSKSTNKITNFKWKTKFVSNFTTSNDSYSEDIIINKEQLEGVAPNMIMNKDMKLLFRVPAPDANSFPVSYKGKLIQNEFVLEFAAVTSTLVFFDKDNVISFDLEVVKSQEVEANTQTKTQPPVEPSI